MLSWLAVTSNVLAWLTPDDIPASSVRRVITIPNDDYWLALLIGALVPLSVADNWQQYGDMTPEESAQEWTNIIELFTQGEECP